MTRPYHLDSDRAVRVVPQSSVPSGTVASAVAGLSSSAMHPGGGGSDGGSDVSESGSESSSNGDERSNPIKIEG